MLVVDERRLPGVRFEPQPSPPAEVLPRMDIAAFVGFAARGPLDTPVPVEDTARFTEVFGGDVALAWDAEQGEPATGHLRAAVHAFFRNGGRRCWVVRVAGSGATAARFPIPGMLHLDTQPDADREGHLRPARLRASSNGSWSHGYVAAASVDVTVLRVAGRASVRLVAADAAVAAREGVRTAYDVSVHLALGSDLAPGDMLRVRLIDDRIVYLPVVGIARDRDGTRATITGMRGAWFRSVPLSAGATGRVAYTDASGLGHAARATVGPEQPGPRMAAVDIFAEPGAWPVAGSWLRFDVGGRRWWLVAQEVHTVKVPGDPAERVRVTGPAALSTGPARAAFSRSFPVLDPAAASDDATAPSVELVRVTLWSGRGERLHESRRDRALGPGHARSLAALPTDERLFGGDPDRPWTRPEPGSVAFGERFPLAGTDDGGWFVPLFLTDVPRWIAGPLGDAASMTDPDGLLSATPDVFLDPALAFVGPADLLARADFIRFESPTPRSLRGVHGLLGVEEASLVAVPDAGQPSWAPGGYRGLPWRRSPARPEVECEPFELCDPGAPAIPQPRIRRDRLDQRSYSVAWPPVPGASGYRVELAHEPESWQRPTYIEHRLARHRVLRAAPGGYRYRVQAIGEHGESDWSRPVRIAVEAVPPAVVKGREETAGAFRVHLALLRMCAARGDLFAVLSLPEAVGAAGVLDHVEALRVATTGASRAARSRLPAPDLDPAAVLSYGSIYYPWLHTVADEATVEEPLAAAAPAADRPPRRLPTRAGTPTAIPRPRPPDGAVAGVFAHRARTRGAWVAPANVPLHDVVALVRPADDAELTRLHGDGVNVVRALPVGFLSLAAETLSVDPVWRHVNVRRLLSLVRRVALLHGAQYVFEPNDDAFRRRIQRGFEALLAGMYERGAFAGARASDAFRVAVGDPPNTPRSVDAGRLIVELKVAPSLPLHFLTVRLVRAGERLAVEAA